MRRLKEERMAMEVGEELDAEESDEIIRAKWVMDGATTLEAAADKLRRMAGILEGLSNQGWKLRAPINDDYGFIYLDS